MTSTPGSPGSKVKFLCSHGGKILPRPADGTLKYVGGETRVVSVPRDVNFADLVKKLATLTDGETVLKYQLLTEDLDSLVTVKSDEDLRYMLDEYDRHESAGTHMLRAFLFPINPLLVDTIQTSPSKEPQAIEQRYLDAINGIIRPTTGRHSSNSNYPSPFCPSSACSSPRSPESSSVHHGNYDTVQTHMHKVQSSPSISSLNNNNHQHQNPYLQNYHQAHYHGFQSPSPQRDGWKYQLSPGGYGQPGGVHSKENGCYCSNCLKLDEYRKIMAGEGVSWSPPYGRSPS